MHKELAVTWGIIAILDSFLAINAASNGNTFTFILWLIAACLAARVSGINLSMLDED